MSFRSAILVIGVVIRWRITEQLKVHFVISVKPFDKRFRYLREKDDVFRRVKFHRLLVRVPVNANVFVFHSDGFEEGVTICNHALPIELPDDIEVNSTKGTRRPKRTKMSIEAVDGVTADVEKVLVGETHEFCRRRNSLSYLCVRRVSIILQNVVDHPTLFETLARNGFGDHFVVVGGDETLEGISHEDGRHEFIPHGRVEITLIGQKVHHEFVERPRVDDVD